MPRNLDRRVEALTAGHRAAAARPPRRDPRRSNLADDVLAWELGADGTWRKVPTVVGVDTHRRLGELAEARRATDDRRCPSVR